MLHDRLAVGCCSLDVLVELLNVCLELLDAGGLRGVGLRRGVAGCRGRKLRLELGHALGERLARLLAGAELAGGVVEARGEICDSRFLGVGNLSRWVGVHDRRGHKRRAVYGGRIHRNHSERRRRVLTLGLLPCQTDLRIRQNGPNRGVRGEPGIGHRAQAGADAVLGLQEAAVLLGERVCDRARARRSRARRGSHRAAGRSDPARRAHASAGRG